MGNVVFEMASHLANLGHEVEVFTPNYYEPKEIKSEEAPPARTHEEDLQERIDFASRLETPISYGNAAYMPQVSRELDDFDVVHLHYPFFGTANIVRKWKLRHPEKPLVITYHMDTRGDGLKGLIFKYYAKYWMPKILHSADAVIASSFDYIKSSDAALLSTEKEMEGKWIEVPFGIDTERFQPRELPENLFKRYGLDHTAPVILFVGGMDKPHYFKGIPVLLKALFLLKEMGLPCQAVCVGDGELRQGFIAQATGLGLGPLVRFVGRVSDEGLPYHYNMADLLVLPSTTRGEAFGMVLLEAMASGVPVVASDLPGVRTIAREGGVVVKPNDPVDLANAVSHFFSNTNNRKEWSVSVRKTAEEYSWDNIAGGLEMIYKELVGE